jgi:aromatic ring-opening dioxygenase catalytic subunit (LigB family)
MGREPIRTCMDFEMERKGEEFSKKKYMFIPLAATLLSTLVVAKAPAIFLNHGSGSRTGLRPEIPDHAPIVETWRETGRLLFSSSSPPPSAIIFCDSHEDQDVFTISRYGSPPRVFPDSEHPDGLDYSIRGSPAIADEMHAAFSAAGIDSTLSASRGLDLAAFIVLKYILPSGSSVPVIRLSIKKTRNAEEHFDMGRVLEAFRDDNIAIIGSGMTFHGQYARFEVPGAHPQALVDEMEADSLAFARDLSTALQTPIEGRRAALGAWEGFEKAFKGTNEWTDVDHIMPLMVLGGAAGSDDFHENEYKYGSHVEVAEFKWYSDDTVIEEEDSSDDKVPKEEKDSANENTPKEEKDKPVGSDIPESGLIMRLLQLDPAASASTASKTDKNQKEATVEKEDKDKASALSSHSFAAFSVVVAVILTI